MRVFLQTPAPGAHLTASVHTKTVKPVICKKGGTRCPKDMSDEIYENVDLIVYTTTFGE